MQERPSNPYGRSGTYLAALDGLRGLAVVMVMLFHITQQGFVQGGYIGVDIFFVLSGYLITSLLLVERQRTGGIDIGAFYVRRALRLLPALFVVMFSALVLVQLPALMPDRRQTVRAVPFVLLYVGNWASSLDGHNALGLLSHTWSLAVEEQYYLAWPLVLAVSLSPWKRPTVARALILLVVLIWVSRAWMVLTGVGWAHVYFSGAEHSDGLLAGSALALMSVHAPGDRHEHRGRGFRPLPPAALALLIGLALTGDNTFSAAWTAAVPLAVMSTCVLIQFAVECSGQGVYRFLSWKPAVWVGRRSYGLYLWHIPVYMTLRSEMRGPPWLIGAVGIVITLALETVCYERIEVPALRIKERFRRGSLEADLVPPSGLRATIEPAGGTKSTVAPPSGV